VLLYSKRVRRRSGALGATGTLQACALMGPPGMPVPLGAVPGDDGTVELELIGRPSEPTGAAAFRSPRAVPSGRAVLQPPMLAATHGMTTRIALTCLDRNIISPTEIRGLNSQSRTEFSMTLPSESSMESVDTGHVYFGHFPTIGPKLRATSWLSFSHRFLCSHRTGCVADGRMTHHRAYF